MSNDAEPTTRSLSVPCGQSLALRPGNALVTRGLRDIAQLGNRARAAELVELGKKCGKKGECDEAIAFYTEAIRLDPKYAEAYFCRAHAYSNKQDYDHAIADYTEAIRVDPKYANAYHDRGWTYAYKICEYDRAIADYTECIRLDQPTKSTATYYNRANAYVNKGERAKAEADLAAVMTSEVAAKEQIRIMWADRWDC